MNYKIKLLLILFLLSQTINASQEISVTLEKEPVRPIPDVKIDNPLEVELGRKLFHDTRLSANETISCATCHPLANAGMDNLPLAVGINGNKGIRNTPTIYNSGLNFRQFWDGRVVTLEEQAKHPITNPIEMGADWSDIIKRISQDPWYYKQFSALYPEGINPETISKALAEFQRTLLTPNSPFDRYLKGDRTAINEEAQQGYQLFKSYGCASCHQGVLLGGNMFEKLGVVIEYYSANNESTDLGRFTQTEIEEHRHEFKIPSLRNIELTSPYLHNGSIKTLEEVILIMGKYQLGRTIPEKDINLIALFLKSLTALPGSSIQNE